MKQSAKAMIRGADCRFCWQTLRAASFTMQPELLTNACRIRVARDASFTRNSPNAMLSALNWRFPSCTVSASAACRAASVIPGSPCPNMCTPIPLIMSHLTLPSTSSTSGPFPRPVPRYR